MPPTQLATNRVELSATATSGFAVTFEVVSGPGVIEGNVLSFTGEGTVEVRAVQTGDAQWLPASVTQTVVVVVERAYLVVDLSAGADAPLYSFTSMDEPPGGGFNTDEYKTTKLVLRQIEPGTFTMGDLSEDSYDIPPHQVTLTKPYYMGVFEVTQKQWKLVMGSNPSENEGDARPVEHVSYNMIRGSSAGAGWPGSNAVDSDSFVGRLRAKTGLEFDLPTEAQWEYACRAGTTTDFNNGKNVTISILEEDRYDSALGEVGRFRANQRDGKGGYTSKHTTVGFYLPNAWGLYDMHGNVDEWCLDWYGSLTTSAVTNPVGPSSVSREGRVLRGGFWYCPARSCTSSTRGSVWPGESYYDYYGFRLVTLIPVFGDRGCG